MGRKIPNGLKIDEVSDEVILRAIASTAKDSIFCKDRRRRYTFVNPAMTKQLKLPKSKIIGKTPEEIFDKISAAKIRKVDDTCFRGKKSSAIETIQIKGKAKTFHTIQTPIKDNSERIVGVCGIVRNITELAEYKHLYEESKLNSREIFNSINDMIAVHDAKTGKIIDANRTLCRHFGYSLEELSRLTVADLSVTEEGYDLSIGLQKIRKAASGKPQIFEWKTRSRKGKVSWVEINTKKASISGKRVVLAVLRDIDERKRMEEELKASEEEYKRLFNGMFDAFAYHKIITDRKGRPTDYRFLEANDAFCWMIGKKRQRIIGRKVTEVIKGIKKDDTDWIGIYGDVAQTGKEIMFDSYASMLKRWYQIKAYSPRKGHFVTIFEDITDRKISENIIKRDKEKSERTSEDRLRELQSVHRELENSRHLAEIGKLAGSIAHEIRNPMSVIGLAMRNLEHRYAGISEERSTRNIHKKIAECDLIISNFLGFAKAKAPMFEMTDTAGLIKTCIDEATRINSAWDVDIMFAEPKKACTIEADPVQIQEIIRNVLDNAFKAFPKRKGRIDISLGCSSGWSVINIEDDGEGMDKATLKNIFNAFFTTRVKGTGLGLTVCKLLANLHGGDIVDCAP